MWKESYSFEHNADTEHIENAETFKGEHFNTFSDDVLTQKETDNDMSSEISYLSIREDYDTTYSNSDAIDKIESIFKQEKTLL